MRPNPAARRRRRGASTRAALIAAITAIAAAPARGSIDFCGDGAPSELPTGDTGVDRPQLGILVDTSTSMIPYLGDTGRGLDHLFAALADVPDVEVHVVFVPAAGDALNPAPVERFDRLEDARRRIIAALRAAPRARYRYSPLRQGMAALVADMTCQNCAGPAVIATFSDLEQDTPQDEAAGTVSPPCGAGSEPTSPLGSNSLAGIHTIVAAVDGRSSRTRCARERGTGPVEVWSDVSTAVARGLAQGKGAPSQRFSWQPPPDHELPESSVVEVESAKSGICTGTVVGPRLVLTARHCLPATSVRFGRDPAHPDREISVAAEQAHPDRRADVAVLELAEDADVRPLEVAPTPRLFGANELQFVGYGRSGTNLLGGPRERHHMQLPASAWDCDPVRSARLGCTPGVELVIPAASGVDTCQGDSGGPVLSLVRADGPDGVPRCEWRVVATTVRGLANVPRACGDGGVYARMDFADSWLEPILKRGEL